MVNTSSRRVVSRPGVNTEGSGSTFQSPYQPPPAGPDFAGDLTLADPDAYTMVHVCDYFWRIRIPGPQAMLDVSMLPDLKRGEQVKAINAFLQQHMHPDDFRTALLRLLRPDDSFDATDMSTLYREAVTVGTARPFWQSRVSRGSPFIAGASSEPSWLGPAWARPSRR